MALNDPIDVTCDGGPLFTIEIHPDRNGYLPPVIPAGGHFEHDGCTYRVYEYTQFTDAGYDPGAMDAPPWTYAHRYIVTELP